MKTEIQICMEQLLDINLNFKKFTVDEKIEVNVFVDISFSLLKSGWCGGTFCSML